MKQHCYEQSLPGMISPLYFCYAHHVHVTKQPNGQKSISMASIVILLKTHIMQGNQMLFLPVQLHAIFPIYVRITAPKLGIRADI